MAGPRGAYAFAHRVSGTFRSAGCCNQQLPRREDTCSRPKTHCANQAQGSMEWTPMDDAEGTLVPVGGPELVKKASAEPQIMPALSRELLQKLLQRSRS